MVRRAVLSLLLMCVFVMAGTIIVFADDGTSPAYPGWSMILAWLVPVGLGMVACGAVPTERTAAVIRIGWLALGISVISYWLCGFAFQFGGAGFFFDHPDLAGLVREWVWKPVDTAWGGGMLGLEGYMLRGAASTPVALTLFLAQLPWMVTAVAILLWSLQERTGTVVLFLAGLLAAVLFTILSNWTWGGGWLSSLGLNVGLGHGFVDAWGIGPVHLASAASAFAGMLALGTRKFMNPQHSSLSADTPSPADQDRETYVPMPPLHLPILATLGAWLALVGWIGWGLSTPLTIAADPQISFDEMLVGLMLAIAGGALVSGTFCWLITGQANALMVARGALGAMIAAGAGVPFMPFWAALAVGAGAGLLVPLVQYLIEHVLRLDDPTSVVATHGLPALWGLLAVGLFADGHAGQGWNRVGIGAYLGIEEQGVTGYLAATGHAHDWPGQFQAQTIGALAIALVAFFLFWALLGSIQGLTKAWRGDYRLRLPKPATDQPSMLSQWAERFKGFVRRVRSSSPLAARLKKPQSPAGDQKTDE